MQNQNGLETSTAQPVLVKASRGRPAKYANAAERVAAHRVRNQIKQVNVEFPEDTAELLRAYVIRQQADGRALTQSQVIVELVQKQLLRKR